MDLTFYANGTGGNVVIFYVSTEGITSFDVRLTNPCNSETKDATFDAIGCSGHYELNFFGVESFYEDLDSGLVYFGNLGTWKAELYNSGASKVPANLLQTIYLQITTLS